MMAVAIASFWFWSTPVIAQMPGADAMISGNWIISAIGAIATACALFWGKTQHDTAKAAVTKTKTTLENQPIGIAVEKALATAEEMQALEHRIEDELTEIKVSLRDERTAARIAQGNTHARIDKMMEGQAEARGELKQINTNLNRLLERSMKGPSAR
jgi:hypothetical protein